MKHVVTICLLHCLAFVTIVRSGDDALDKARSLLLGGQYSEAAELLAPLAKEDPAAMLSLARCLSSQGKLDEAVENLTAAADGRAELQAELAQLGFQRGNYREAKTRADEAIRLDGQQLQALWIRAELDRTAGRLEEAERGYSRLISHYNNHDVERAESLHRIGLAAARYARWNRLSGQFHFLVNSLYPDALKLEPDYWPAHYEAGMLFLEKYNRSDAADEFNSALKLNPNAAEVHTALARLAIEQRKIEQAETSIARALEINPRLLSAWLAKADLAWANFKVEQSLELLQDNALPLNPLSEETLGRMAACYVLLDGPPKKDGTTRLSELIGDVRGRNPHAGEFLFTLASQLMTRNKHDLAEHFFLETIDKMPQKVGPRSHLGLLYMRTGRETEAREILGKAFEVDPFNVRVKNTLEVLDVLDSMETLDTGNFIIKFDGQRDRLLARYAAKRLEAIYPDWCRQFGSRPRGKPLLEVFNQAQGTNGHGWFSARMTGLPHLGPVAASTGWIVAMASPNEPGASRRYNWWRVLKHEVAHVFTLQQTRFNIPHWYTEGLSVYSEGCPRPQLWNELLLQRVPEGRLFDLQTLNFAFSRPHSSRDWQLAYCQAELYVDYMLSRFGSGRQRKLLAAYGRQLSTAEAIREAFGVSEEEFERGYVAYLEELIAEMSTLKGPSQADYANLLAAHRDRPKDADAAAELAYAHLRRRADKEARQTAQTALKEDPKHQLATYVLARLALQEKETREAVEMLEDCLDEQSPHRLALNLLAELKLKAEEYDEAARLFSLGERLDSINLKWTKALGRVYLLSKNEQKLIRVLARLARADAADLSSRKKLAQMALDRRDYQQAADWAKGAIEINVMDSDVHRVYAEALVGLEEYAEAIEEFEVAIELDPTEPQRRFALADVCIQANQPEKARQSLNSLLEMVPDYPGADLLLKSLEENDP